MICSDIEIKDCIADISFALIPVLRGALATLSGYLVGTFVITKTPVAVYVFG
jgi:hypothetical protein